jgi:NitT/TauT family transport system permease protein
MRAATKFQVGSLALFLLVLEVITRTGLVSAFTLIPPSQMFHSAFELLSSGRLTKHLQSTLGTVALAAFLAIVTGFVFASLIHRFAGMRRVLEPYLASYYAVPVFAFYPLFIFIFGLNSLPKIMIAYLYAVVAMVVNTLNGLDRIPRVHRKTARVFNMNPVRTALQITLPAAVPYVFAGVKLAVAYSFLGTIASEFILSASGLGYQIGYAYHNFDNRTLYGVITIILALSVALNLFLLYWERAILSRRGAR